MDGIATQAGMFNISGGGTTFPAPTHYWDLDTTGFVDSAGGWTLTQNDGTVTVNSTGGPDGGPAVDLDLPEELIRTGGETWDGVQDNLTVSIWAKIDNLSSVGNWLFSWRGGSANNELVQVLVNSSGIMRASIFDSVGSAVTAGSTTVIGTGSWYHLVMTHDGSTVKAYLNGVLEQSLATPSFPGYSTQLMPIALGNQSWNLIYSDSAHDGLLAKCGLWDVALTGSEINTLYNSGNGLNYADL